MSEGSPPPWGRLIRDPASGRVWTTSPLARPWPFGTIVRRSRKNLAEIKGVTTDIAAQRILVLLDSGSKSFTGLTIHDGRPEFVGRTDDTWIADYWEPV